MLAESALRERLSTDKVTDFSEMYVFQMVANYLNISIKDTEESLKDGVILCQLLNEMKKNAVRIINMPQVIS